MKETKDSNVMCPVRTISVRGKTVEVRELTWRDSMRAVKELTGWVMKLLGGQKGKLTADSVTLDKDSIVEALTTQEDLVAWAMEKSTNLSADEVSSLTLGEAIPIVQAMVDLNLSEEVLGPGKALAGRLGQVFGLKIALPKPQTTSSPTDTP